MTDQLPLAWPSYIAGEPVQTDDTLEVRYPWDGSLTGTLPKITPEQLEQAIQAGLGQAKPGRGRTTPNYAFFFLKIQYFAYKCLFGPYRAWF